MAITEPGRLLPHAAAVGRPPPLVVHILDHLAVGGLETVMIELINATGATTFRHAVICLSGYTDFRRRIRPAVTCYTLNKRPGKDLRVYWRLWRLLRRLRPNLVQTYNIGAIDAALPARLAGVPVVIHAEHGRNASDPHGRDRKYNRLRRWLRPFITRYVTVSQDLQTWLTDDVGLPEGKVVHIYNGVDLLRYRPDERANQRRHRSQWAAFAPDGTTLFATVGRLDPVKNHAGLIHAFAQLKAEAGEAAARSRLLIAGGGPEADTLRRLIDESGLTTQIRLAGERDDVARWLPEIDVFVNSSITEGISLTILEAMACARPVIASAVGGNRELVEDGETGFLVPARDPTAMAAAMKRYLSDPELGNRHGAAGRSRVEAAFSLESMVDGYVALYRGLVEGRSRASGSERP